MNPKSPVYGEILKVCAANEIRSYRLLAIAVRRSFGSTMGSALTLEAKKRLVRDQNGVFRVIGPLPEPEPEPTSAIPEFKERQPAYIAERVNRNARERQLNPPKTPYRPKQRTQILEAVIEQSEMVLKDAPPNDPELGRQIRESKPPSVRTLRAQERAEKRRVQEAAEAERREAIEKRKAERAERAAARRAEQEALSAAKRAATERTQGGRHCFRCMGLGERRPKERPCPGCGQEYEREVVKFSPVLFSPIATFE
jgi:hypothetical protein